MINTMLVISVLGECRARVVILLKRHNFSVPFLVKTEFLIFGTIFFIDSTVNVKL